MKKVLCLCIVLLTILCLGGCCLSHSFTQATCTSPATCTKCGKTEGEALGHTWVDATCTNSKTCSVCGKTEGEALGHKWKAATYSSPKTCTVCGKTEGVKLHDDTADAESKIKGSWKSVQLIIDGESVTSAAKLKKCTGYFDSDHTGYISISGDKTSLSWEYTKTDSDSIGYRIKIGSDYRNIIIVTDSTSKYNNCLVIYLDSDNAIILKK